MAIKFDTFKVGSGGAGTDNLDDVTSRGSITTNSITVGGVTVGTEYSLPSADGSANQVISTNGSGTLTFTTLDFTGGLEYKGSYDITAAPSLTSAKKGDFYIITNGPGTIAGVSFEDGDHIVFNQDASSPLTSAMFDKIDNSEAYTTLASLTDTNISTPANGQVLKHNGTSWVNTQLAYSELSGTPTNVSTFTNDANYVASGDNVSVLTNDANYVASGDNVSTLTNDAGYLTDITGENLGDLSDVTVTTPTSGQVLSYNGANWVNSAASSGSLAGLSDVTITAAANGDYLRYNGSAWVDATLAVVDDTTPSLGGNLDVNGNSITSSANGDVTINPDGTGSIAIGADVIPDADVTHTLGSEDFRYITTYSDLNGAVRFKAKNDEGSAITAGQVLYIKGLAGDGETPTVGLADADDASKMPAFGLAYAGANDQAEVQVVSFGNLYNVNTSSFSVGDTLYVSTTAGALTNTKPTGETSQLQNIGRVVRSDASAGVITVGGAGRSAATPNLNDGYFFLGNASNQSVSTQLSSINVSTFVNDAGYLANINSENLGDLSDVTVTTPSSGQVLSYNGANWVNAAASGGGGYAFSAISGATSAQIQYHYSCDTSGGAFALTLPALSGVTSGQEIRVKLATAGNNLTIAVSGSDTIDGLSSYTLSVAKSSITLVANASATDWEIV